MSAFPAPDALGDLDESHQLWLPYTVDLTSYHARFGAIGSPQAARARIDDPISR